MGKNNKKKNKQEPIPIPEQPVDQAAETEQLTPPSREEQIEDLRKAIIQEAILLEKRQRSSIVDLDKATRAYLDFVGEDESKN
jgi:hypothetical protein